MFRLFRSKAQPLTVIDLGRFYQMVHADVQALVDEIKATTTQLPTPEQIETAVTTAVSNAEAAKDTDHADDVAALSAALTDFQTAVIAVNGAIAAINAKPA